MRRVPDWGDPTDSRRSPHCRHYVSRPRSSAKTPTGCSANLGSGSIPRRSLRTSPFRNSHGVNLRASYGQTVHGSTSLSRSSWRRRGHRPFPHGLHSPAEHLHDASHPASQFRGRMVDRSGRRNQKSSPTGRGNSGDYWAADPVPNGGCTGSDRISVLPIVVRAHRHTSPRRRQRSWLLPLGWWCRRGCRRRRRWHLDAASRRHLN